MIDNQSAAHRAARAVLERLQANAAIETERPGALVGEIMTLLGRYESALDALVSAAAATTTSLSAAQNELERRSTGAGVPLDEEALPTLLAKICALLLDSDNVDELFADDAELSKVVRAA